MPLEPGHFGDSGIDYFIHGTVVTLLLIRGCFLLLLHENFKVDSSAACFQIITNQSIITFLFYI